MLKYFVLLIILCLLVIAVGTFFMPCASWKGMANSPILSPSSNPSSSPSSIARSSPSPSPITGSSSLRPSSGSSCCSIAGQKKLEDLCPEGAKNVSGTCSCKDYILCKLVMVTAISSNHFKEVIDYIGSVHALFPHTKIIVYDLGLKASQSRTISSYCNTEIRRFDFSKYPNHVKTLKKYAWKPFIIEEMSEEYEIFFFCDASIRVTQSVKNFIPNLLKFPVLPCSRLEERLQVMKSTHDGMFRYLNLTGSREQLASLSPTFESGSVIYWANNLFKENFLPKWIDCAMHVECIAPKGSTVHGCDFKKKVWPKKVYAGCHRYDQSALNVILYRDFAESMKLLFGEGGLIPDSCGLVIARWPTYMYTKSLCINNSS